MADSPEAYDEVLTATLTRVRGALDVAPTSRVKNTGTILEKLQRQGGSWLKNLHDLAGMRIVGVTDRREQDAIVEQLVALFADEPRPPKVIDRRATPSHGYRAVHVVVFPEGMAVEIQVRTRWQHEWADLFEKLADRIGRDIRYGEPPEHRPSAPERAHAIRLQTVDAVLSVAELISGVEAAAVTHPQGQELQDLRRASVQGLFLMRQALKGLDAAD
jgi:ppGpp synthetase/RelA/SpoT-type nucleotidyltranferase